MQQSGQQRYLDLDRRLSLLMQQPGAAFPATEATPPLSSSPVAAEPTVPAADAYKQAMTLVRNKQFVEAQQAFDEFAQNYPGDELVANAWYWSGEVALVHGQHDLALTQFKKVIDQYPEHGKTPDASYKYAVTLHKQGRIDEARQWLQKVINSYAGKADATVQLARSYLKTL